MTALDVGLSGSEALKTRSEIDIEKLDSTSEERSQIAVRRVFLRWPVGR